MGWLSDFFGLTPEQVGPTQADVTAAGQPYGLTTPVGSVSWDQAAKTGRAEMSPGMAALADRLMARSEAQAEAISGFDPATQAQEYYQQYIAPDLLRSQERARLASENRLRAQGMLGSTGGAAHMRGLGESQAAARRAGQAQAFQQSQTLLDQMRQRELADVAQSIALMEAPAALFGPGSSVGGNLGQIMAQYRPQYQQGTGTMLLGGLTGLASGGAFGEGGLFADLW